LANAITRLASFCGRNLTVPPERRLPAGFKVRIKPVLSQTKENLNPDGKAKAQSRSQTGAPAE